MAAPKVPFVRSSPRLRSDWEEELLEVARQIVASDDDRFVGVPGKYEVIDEWVVMHDFGLTLEGRAQEDILDTIQGSGAFRRFRREIDRHDLRDKWYAFRDAAFRKVAQDWCKENNINVDESS